MEKRLFASNILGLRKTISRTAMSKTNIDTIATYQSNRLTEKACLEAERKKTGAIIITRRINFR